MRRVVSIFMLLLLVLAFVGAQETRYTYRVFQISPIELQKVLDSQGSDGFRVVSITWLQPYFILVMERPF